MKKMGSVFEEILFDRKLDEANMEHDLKIFYNVDIRVSRGDEGKATSYAQRTSGDAAVVEKDVANIQNLHNLIDYASNLIENGKPLVNELVAEIIKTVSDQGKDAIVDLVQEEDRIIIDIDYGFEDMDSIGLKLNKTPGSSMVSFSMKKDGNIIPGDFKMEIFEQQILAMRKRYMEKE